MTLEINIEGVEKLVKKFENNRRALDRNIKRAMDKSFDMMKAETEYPPYAYRSIASIGGFVSDKQRRYVMAKIHSGEITPGKSNRGGTLGKSLTGKTTGSGIYTVGEFGTNLSYAKYVISDKDQSAMHKGHWWTMKDIYNKVKSKVISIFNDLIKSGLES